MEERNWAERLALYRVDLSKRELEVIDFVSNHPLEASFLKQNELCLRAGVSKPIVISCFRRLGYEDYQDFLEGIRGFYAGQIDSAQASLVALHDVADVPELISLALDVEAATIETLRRQLQPAQVEALARLLLDSREIYLYAEGSGFEPAHYLYQRLRRCGLRASLVGLDRPHLLDDLAPLGAGGLFVTFFYTQDARIVAELLDYVRAHGAVSALITGAPDPELYRRTDHHVFVPRGQWNFKNSMAAPMAFAQILLLAVELLGGTELQEGLKQLESERKNFDSGYREEAS
ncbi:MAG TPA: MurR/RpiR family transcriptional regulator [Rectinemataceae bacterium]|nr:MurR/RpiR family transcriptional regulator [Rectinemataceae bacterium]